MYVLPEYGCVLSVAERALRCTRWFSDELDGQERQSPLYGFAKVAPDFMRFGPPQTLGTACRQPKDESVCNTPLIAELPLLSHNPLCIGPSPPFLAQSRARISLVGTASVPAA